MERNTLSLFIGIFWLACLPAGAANVVAPPTQEKNSPSPTANTESSIVAITPKNDLDESLKNIQNLRKQGELEKAKQAAIEYLAKQPKDIDAKLLLGLVYIQLNQYDEANQQILPVLEQSPTYMDARLALIKIRMHEKKYDEADALATEGLKQQPYNSELETFKKNILFLKTPPKEAQPQPEKKTTYTQTPTKSNRPLVKTQKRPIAKKRSQTILIAKQLPNENPRNVEMSLALADAYLARKNDMRALFIIQRSLKFNPNNEKLLAKEGQIQSILSNYSLALNSFKKVLAQNPKNDTTQTLFEKIMETRPRFKYGVNEVGISTSNYYVNELHSIWDYSTLYYTRDTDLGPVTGKVNYTSRQGIDAPQFELNFSPRFNRQVYFELATGFANEPALFPKEMYAAEGFFYTTPLTQISAGAKYSNIGHTYFSTYTGSLNFYPGNYWISFRPYFFVPKNTQNNSTLYTGVIRRYFDTDDHYISLSGGTGYSPDLADLLTVNFIVIRNNFINLNYEFPIFNHKYVIDLGGGYNNWKYPRGLVRNLYSGLIAIKYRF